MRTAAAGAPGTTQAAAGRVASGRVVASPVVFIEADDAKTDVILAAAVAVIGPSLVGFVSRLPLLPRTGALGVLVDIIWLAAVTLLVPVLLARYRGDGIAAFGFRSQGGHLAVAGTPGATTSTVLLVLPVAVVGVGTVVLVGGGPVAAVLGSVGLSLEGGADLGQVGMLALRVAVLTIGAVVLVGFLSVRSRDGFPRSPDTSLTELVRTFGLGATAAALLTGLVRVATGGPLLALALHLLALVAVLLLVDRLVPAGVSVPRTTVVAPLVLVVVIQTFAAGGLLGGGLLTGLHRGALAAGVTIAIAATAATRRGVVVAVPMVLAVHWWPTCLSPLPGAGGLC